MKKAHILHNPNAGNQEKSKKELIKLIESSGFKCGYSSTKKIGWKKMHPKTTFLIVAGGDGTIRQVATGLLQKKRYQSRLPVLLLPLGTANNVAKSLGLEGEIDDILKNTVNGNLKKYDVGRIKGLKEEMTFLESFGFGVFPELMQRMKEIPERKDATPEENLQHALGVLHGIIINHPAHTYTVTIDGILHSDNYILAEIMNTPSIGPNLNLSPDSDPGDGEFEIILVSDRQREEFASYVSNKMNGIEQTFTPVLFKGRKISITAGPGAIHVDDELMELKKTKKIRISPEAGMIEFFVQ